MLADIKAFVPWPGLRPVRELRRRRDGRAAASTSSSPGSRSTSSSPPATAPATSPTRSPTSDALFSGDVLFQGSVGRVDLPGGDGPTLLREHPRAGRGLPGRDDRLPGPHGDHHARRRARLESVPRRAGSLGSRRWPRRFQAPKGTFDVLPEERASARGSTTRRGGDPRARRLRADRDPGVRGHGAVRARGRRGTDIVRKEMFTFRTRAGASSRCAPRARRRLPRLPRARDAQAPAAGEALVLGARSSATSARRPAATASSTRSTPRRSAPTRRSPTPSRSSCSTSCCASSGSPGSS